MKIKKFIILLTFLKRNYLVYLHACNKKPEMKKTLVLGASSNPMRFSHKMIKTLLRHDYEVVALGLREGEIAGVKILTGKPKIEKVHTISMYIGPKRQPEYYDYLLSLKPQRIIFNPGTINKEFMKIAERKGIDIVTDCALIMVSSGHY